MQLLIRGDGDRAPVVLHGRTGAALTVKYGTQVAMRDEQRVVRPVPP